MLLLGALFTMLNRTPNQLKKTARQGYGTGFSLSSYSASEASGLAVMRAIPDKRLTRQQQRAPSSIFFADLDPIHLDLLLLHLKFLHFCWLRDMSKRILPQGSLQDHTGKKERDKKLNSTICFSGGRTRYIRPFAPGAIQRGAREREGKAKVPLLISLQSVAVRSSGQSCLNFACAPLLKTKKDFIIFKPVRFINNAKVGTTWLVGCW